MDRTTRQDIRRARTERDARVCEDPRPTTLGVRERALVAAGLIALALALALPALARGAETAVPTGTLRVRAGDSLWAIALRCPGGKADTLATVREIRRLNRLETSELAAGQTLVVPADELSLAVASR